MASVAYNSFKLNLMEAVFNIETHASMKMALLETVTTTPDNPDHDFMDDISADEFADTGYTGGFNGAGRKALSNKAATVDNTNNRAQFDYDDITWTTLGTGDTVVMAVMIRENTNDAGTNLCTLHDIANTATNGSDFTLQPGSTGALHLT